MEIKRGTPVSPGVAIGPALVIDTEGFRIPLRTIDKKQRKEEIIRLHAALEKAAVDARAKQQHISEKLGKNYGAIFAAHAMLMEDPELVKEIEFLIKDQNHAAESAASRVMRRHIKAMETLERGQFSSRNTADL